MLQIKWNDTHIGIIIPWNRFDSSTYIYIYHIFIKYIPVGYYYSFARCTSPQGQQTKRKQCTHGFNCVS